MCTHANSRFTVVKVIENKHLALGNCGKVNYITSYNCEVLGRHEDFAARKL